MFTFLIKSFILLMIVGLLMVQCTGYMVTNAKDCVYSYHKYDDCGDYFKPSKENV